MCNLKDVFTRLGGGSSIAKRYGFKPQRVSNWVIRQGIPADILLDYPGFKAELERAGYVREGSEERQPREAQG